MRWTWSGGFVWWLLVLAAPFLIGFSGFTAVVVFFRAWPALGLWALWPFTALVLAWLTVPAQASLFRIK